CVFSLCMYHHYYLFCIYFFFKLQHPTSSTLFPYTTLFRSKHLEAETTNISTAVKLVKSRSGIFGISTPFKSSRVISLRFKWCRKDRKSTRLNSSHVSISYAVFCLKKKKINLNI